MRISGITIPDHKRLEVSLTAIYGIGRARAKSILDSLNVDWGKKASELTTEEENAIRKAVESFQIEGDLRRDTAQNIKRLKDISAYRGIRHMRKLPARGQ